MYKEDDKARVLALYESGLSARQVAAQIDVSHTTVVRLAREAGILRPRVESGRRGAPVGATRSDKNGYVLEKTERGWVLQHRLVLERELGRRLRRDETIHHVNGDRADNRSENLQLRQGGHGKGARLRCRSCGSHDLEPVSL